MKGRHDRLQRVASVVAIAGANAATSTTYCYTSSLESHSFPVRRFGMTPTLNGMTRPRPWHMRRQDPPDEQQHQSQSQQAHPPEPPVASSTSSQEGTYHDRLLHNLMGQRAENDAKTFELQRMKTQAQEKAIELYTSTKRHDIRPQQTGKRFNLVDHPEVEDGIVEVEDDDEMTGDDDDDETRQRLLHGRKRLEQSSAVELMKAGRLLDAYRVASSQVENLVERLKKAGESMKGLAAIARYEAEEGITGGLVESFLQRPKKTSTDKKGIDGLPPSIITALATTRDMHNRNGLKHLKQTLHSRIDAMLQHSTTKIEDVFKLDDKSLKQKHLKGQKDKDKDNHVNRLPLTYSAVGAGLTIMMRAGGEKQATDTIDELLKVIHTHRDYVMDMKLINKLTVPLESSAPTTPPSSSSSSSSSRSRRRRQGGSSSQDHINTHEIDVDTPYHKHIPDFTLHPTFFADLAMYFVATNHPALAYRLLQGVLHYNLPFIRRPSFLNDLMVCLTQPDYPPWVFTAKVIGMTDVQRVGRYKPPSVREFNEVDTVLPLFLLAVRLTGAGKYTYLPSGFPYHSLIQYFGHYHRIDTSLFWLRLARAAAYYKDKLPLSHVNAEILMPADGGYLSSSSSSSSSSSTPGYAEAAALDTTHASSHLLSPNGTFQRDIASELLRLKAYLGHSPETEWGGSTMLQRTQSPALLWSLLPTPLAKVGTIAPDMLSEVHFHPLLQSLRTSMNSSSKGNNSTGSSSSSCGSGNGSVSSQERMDASIDVFESTFEVLASMGGNTINVDASTQLAYTQEDKERMAAQQQHRSSSSNTNNNNNSNSGLSVGGAKVKGYQLSLALLDIVLRHTEEMNTTLVHNEDTIRKNISTHHQQYVTDDNRQNDDDNDDDDDVEASDVDEEDNNNSLTSSPLPLGSRVEALIPRNNTYTADPLNHRYTPLVVTPSEPPAYYTQTWIINPFKTSKSMVEGEDTLSSSSSPTINQRSGTTDAPTTSTNKEFTIPTSRNPSSTSSTSSASSTSSTSSSASSSSTSSSSTSKSLDTTLRLPRVSTSMYTNVMRACISAGAYEDALRVAFTAEQGLGRLPLFESDWKLIQSRDTMYEELNKIIREGGNLNNSSNSTSGANSSNNTSNISKEIASAIDKFISADVELRNKLPWVSVPLPQYARERRSTSTVNSSNNSTMDSIGSVSTSRDSNTTNTLSSILKLPRPSTTSGLIIPLTDPIHVINASQHLLLPSCRYVVPNMSRESFTVCARASAGGPRQSSLDPDFIVRGRPALSTLVRISNVINDAIQEAPTRQETALNVLKQLVDPTAGEQNTNTPLSSSSSSSSSSRPSDPSGDKTLVEGEGDVVLTVKDIHSIGMANASILGYTNKVRKGGNYDNNNNNDNVDLDPSTSSELGSLLDDPYRRNRGNNGGWAARNGNRNNNNNININNRNAPSGSSSSLNIISNSNNNNNINNNNNSISVGNTNQPPSTSERIEDLLMSHVKNVLDKKDQLLQLLRLRGYNPSHHITPLTRSTGRRMGSASAALTEGDELAHVTNRTLELLSRHLGRDTLRRRALSRIFSSFGAATEAKVVTLDAPESFSKHVSRAKERNKLDEQTICINKLFKAPNRTRQFCVSSTFGRPIAPSYEFRRYPYWNQTVNLDIQFYQLAAQASSALHIVPLTAAFMLMAQRCFLYDLLQTLPNRTKATHIIRPDGTMVKTPVFIGFPIAHVDSALRNKDLETNPFTKQSKISITRSDDICPSHSYLVPDVMSDRITTEALIGPIDKYVHKEGTTVNKFGSALSRADTTSKPSIHFDRNTREARRASVSEAFYLRAASDTIQLFLSHGYLEHTLDLARTIMFLCEIPTAHLRADYFFPNQDWVPYTSLNGKESALAIIYFASIRAGSLTHARSRVTTWLTRIERILETNPQLAMISQDQYRRDFPTQAADVGFVASESPYPSIPPSALWRLRRDAYVDVLVMRKGILDVDGEQRLGYMKVNAIKILTEIEKYFQAALVQAGAFNKYTFGTSINAGESTMIRKRIAERPMELFSNRSMALGVSADQAELITSTRKDAETAQIEQVLEVHAPPNLDLSCVHGLQPDMMCRVAAMGLLYPDHEGGPPVWRRLASLSMGTFYTHHFLAAKRANANTLSKYCGTFRTNRDNNATDKDGSNNNPITSSAASGGGRGQTVNDQGDSVSITQSSLVDDEVKGEEETDEPLVRATDRASIRNTSSSNDDVDAEVEDSVEDIEDVEESSGGSEGEGEVVPPVGEGESGEGGEGGEGEEGGSGLVVARWSEHEHYNNMVSAAAFQLRDDPLVDVTGDVVKIVAKEGLPKINVPEVPFTKEASSFDAYMNIEPPTHWPRIYATRSHEAWERDHVKLMVHMQKEHSAKMPHLLPDSTSIAAFAKMEVVANANRPLGGSKHNNDVSIRTEGIRDRLLSAALIEPFNCPITSFYMLTCMQTINCGNQAIQYLRMGLQALAVEAAVADRGEPDSSITLDPSALLLPSDCPTFPSDYEVALLLLRRSPRNPTLRSLGLDLTPEDYTWADHVKGEGVDLSQAPGFLAMHLVHNISKSTSAYSFPVPRPRSLLSNYHYQTHLANVQAIDMIASAARMICVSGDLEMQERLMLWMKRVEAIANAFVSPQILQQTLPPSAIRMSALERPPAITLHQHEMMRKVVLELDASLAYSPPTATQLYTSEMFGTPSSLTTGKSHFPTLAPKLLPPIEGLAPPYSFINTTMVTSHVRAITKLSHTVMSGHTPATEALIDRVTRAVAASTPPSPSSSPSSSSSTSPSTSEDSSSLSSSSLPSSLPPAVAQKLLSRLALDYARETARRAVNARQFPWWRIKFDGLAFPVQRVVIDLHGVFVSSVPVIVSLALDELFEYYINATFINQETPAMSMTRAFLRRHKYDVHGDYEKKFTLIEECVSDIYEERFHIPQLTLLPPPHSASTKNSNNTASEDTKFETADNNNSSYNIESTLSDIPSLSPHELDTLPSWVSTPIPTTATKQAQENSLTSKPLSVDTLDDLLSALHVDDISSSPSSSSMKSNDKRVNDTVSSPTVNTNEELSSAQASSTSSSIPSIDLDKSSTADGTTIGRSAVDRSNIDEAEIKRMRSAIQEMLGIDTYAMHNGLGLSPEEIVTKVRITGFDFVMGKGLHNLTGQSLLRDHVLRELDQRGIQYTLNAGSCIISGKAASTWLERRAVIRHKNIMRRLGMPIPSYLANVNNYYNYNNNNNNYNNNNSNSSSSGGLNIELSSSDNRAHDNDIRKSNRYSSHYPGENRRWSRSSRR